MDPAHQFHILNDPELKEPIVPENPRPAPLNPTPAPRSPAPPSRRDGTSMKDKLLAINGPLKGTYLEVSRGESRLVVQAGNLTHTYDREGLHSLVFVRTDSVVKDNVTDAMAFSTNQALDHRRTWTLIDRRKVPKALSLPFDDERSVIIAGAAGHIPTNGACFCLMTKTLRIYGETITQVVVAWNRVKTTYSQYSDIAIESISRTNFTCQNGDLSDMTAEMVQCVDMSGCTVPENATID